METYKPLGDVYVAMEMAKTESVTKAKKIQPEFIQYWGLIWPLRVPWSGSFLTSAHHARDFPRHGVFAGIEEYVVEQYREKMVLEICEIGSLRFRISELLTDYHSEHENGINSTYIFPDEYQVSPWADGLTKTSLETLLREEKLGQIFSKYKSEVEEIIKCCSKQSVMLAHPSGTQDSAVVRDAFKTFITVSVRWFQMAIANVHFS
jgi:hypothetical protein